MKETTKWLVALITLSAIFALMGIFWRYFSADFETFQQVYMRTTVACLLLTIVFYRSINFKKYFALEKKEWWLIFLRWAFNYIWVVLFTYGVIHTSLANVSAITLFPSTTIFSIIFLWERLGLQKSIWVGLSLGGLFLIWGTDVNMNLWKWELFALGWDILFWLSYITRRWHSDILSNREIALSMIWAWTIVVFLISILIWEWIPNFEVLGSMNTTTMLLFGWIFNALIIVLLNYGFSKASWILSERILALEVVFALVFWILIYAEFPNKFEILGMAVIIASMFWIQVIEAREEKK